MKEIIKNFLNNLISKANDRNIFHVGASHLATARNNYSSYKNLFEADYKIYSQTGEDGILDFLIHSLLIKKPTFLEIGVGDYRECNTRYLFERYSSKGVIVDQIENLKEKVSKNVKLWKGDLKIIEQSVNSENINEILRKSEINENLDIFSIDIDGIDYWVIKNIPKIHSKIFVAEFNPIFGHEKKITVPNSKNFNRSDYHYSHLCYGMSLMALIELMNNKNFTFIGTNVACHNAFFLANEYVKKINFDLPNNNHLEQFVQNNFRDSRAKNFKLNYKSGKERIKEISDCDVIDLSDGEKVTKIKDLFDF